MPGCSASTKGGSVFECRFAKTEFRLSHLQPLHFPLNPTFQVSVALVLSLGGIEGLSYIWTHPAPGPHWEILMAGLPSSPGRTVGADESLVPLPEVYEKSAPLLRCSSGEVFFKETADGIGLNLAFFEWQGTDTGSVLEAFRHMPEICLGSVGMVLTSTEKPVRYTVGDQTIIFDHTVFRDPNQRQGAAFGSPRVHSFRGIWVAGMDGADFRSGVAGDSLDRLRTIRLKSAGRRDRPPYACVIQGAIRGASSGEEAWKAFERAMLQGIQFKKTVPGKPPI